jgi:soluble lytic murein transglycosylase-like protein
VARRPAALAAALETTTQDLYDAIDRWLARDPHAARSPEDVQLLALYQQRITRVLAGEPVLASRVIGLLPRSVAAITQANVEASTRLFSHARPVSDASVLRTVRPESAGTLLGYYRDAEQRFGVEWQVLAAVNSIESRFGRVRSSSYAGAQGPMQFLPSTWDAYGLGGDVHDPHDAILGAANYLAASGAPGDYRAALYHYNSVEDYVAAVLLYARQMMRDPRTYYAYYNWQVFVFTQQGEVRLTGPER